MRSTISAKAPAGSENRKNGVDATVDISDRKKVDGLSIFIVNVAAVSCAATQIPGITLATHRRLNTGFRKAIHVDVLVILLNNRSGLCSHAASAIWEA